MNNYQDENNNKTFYENPTEKKLVLHTQIRGAIMALIASVTMFFVMYEGLSNTASLTRLFLVALFPALYACVINLPVSKIFKIMPTVFPAVCFAVFALVRYDNTSDYGMFIVQAMLYGVLGLVLTAVLHLGYNKKYTKTALLISGTVAVSVFSALEYVVYLLFNYGKFTISFALEKISEMFSDFCSVMNSSFAMMLDNEEAYNMLLQSVPGAGNITKEALLSTLSQNVNAIAETIRLCLPAIIGVSAMLLVFVMLQFFAWSTKIACLSLETQDGKWEYNVSGVSARVFNIFLFVALFGGFINLPKALLVTCINVVILLVLPLSIVGIRSVFRLLCSKNMHPVGVGVIIGVAILVMLGITNFYTLLLTAFVGEYAVMAQERKKLFPPKNDDNSKE